MRDAPEFIRWQDGYRYDPADRSSWWRSWLDVVVETPGRGVVMRRLRVVSEPLSDHVRYEYDGTFTNVAAGEDVRWPCRGRPSNSRGRSARTSRWVSSSGPRRFRRDGAAGGTVAVDGAVSGMLLASPGPRTSRSADPPKG
ncbi:DUF6879 family protein [Streptomyces sp. NPDC087307]|uniref:DUF6879 family protein n=1 Tax=Streptomyces sp. NPDC087307 TaxID=3365782 RepID=UPI0037F7EDC8